MRITKLEVLIPIVDYMIVNSRSISEACNYIMCIKLICKYINNKLPKLIDFMPRIYSNFGFKFNSCFFEVKSFQLMKSTILKGISKKISQYFSWQTYLVIVSDDNNLFFVSGGQIIKKFKVKFSCTRDYFSIEDRFQNLVIYYKNLNNDIFKRKLSSSIVDYNIYETCIGLALILICWSYSEIYILNNNNRVKFLNRIDFLKADIKVFFNGYFLYNDSKRSEYIPFDNKLTNVAKNDILKKFKNSRSFGDTRIMLQSSSYTVNDKYDNFDIEIYHENDNFSQKIIKDFYVGGYDNVNVYNDTFIYDAYNIFDLYTGNVVFHSKQHMIHGVIKKMEGDGYIILCD